MNKYVKKIASSVVAALISFAIAYYLYTHQLPVQGHVATLIGMLSVYLAVDQFRSRLY